jgi:DNA-binding transcriptional MerR regulator
VNFLDSRTGSRVHPPENAGESEMKKTDCLRIGELARSAGVSPDTVRHYERKGALPRARRSANNYREYPRGALERIRMIRGALAIGFSLDELSRILSQREAGGAPCREVREIAAAKLARIDRAVRDLSALRAALKATLGEWDARLAVTAPGQRAGLLDTLGRTRIRTDSARERHPFPLLRRTSKGENR